MNKSEFFRLRETKFADAEIDRVKLNGSFSGYASIFGIPDLGNDIVEKGAFARSLKKRGPGNIRMLFQHDPADPIGVWQHIEEMPRGLKVAGRICSATTRGREVLALMRAGAIDGLSIGFRTVRAGQTKTRQRRILEADLWEISIVTFPMQENARIEQVKGHGAGARPSIREFERWLVRDAGFTRSEARLITAKGYATLPHAREAMATKMAAKNDLAMRIRAGADRIHPNH